jgi:hypothetical protein
MKVNLFDQSDGAALCCISAMIALHPVAIALDGSVFVAVCYIVCIVQMLLRDDTLGRRSRGSCW